MWNVYSSREEAKEELYKNRHRVDLSKFEVISGSKALEYGLDFIPLIGIEADLKHLRPLLVTFKYKYESNQTKLQKQALRAKIRYRLKHGLTIN